MERLTIDVLNDPAGRDELSVDLLTSEGFRGERHAGSARCEACKRLAQRWFREMS